MPVSDSQLWPSTLPLPQVGERYTLDPRGETLTFESKRTRTRRVYSSYQELAEFEWYFTQDEFDAFKTFFEDTLWNGEFPFYITVLDPDDSSMEVTTDFAFLEDYEFSRSDNLFVVSAVCVVQEQAIDAIPLPFNPGLCGIVIWPSVSDGEGGGTTFECYDAGTYNNAQVHVQMQTAGTGITGTIAHGNGALHYIYGETFEIFPAGALVNATPDDDVNLVLMYYGNNPFRYIYGEDWETFSVGSISDGTPASSTNLTAYYSGDAPP